MRIISIAALLLTAVWLSLDAQAQPEVVWEKKYGDRPYYGARAILASGDGGYMIAADDAADIFISKTDEKATSSGKRPTEARATMCSMTLPGLRTGS